jgi:hypothetical protein
MLLQRNVTTDHSDRVGDDAKKCEAARLGCVMESLEQPRQAPPVGRALRIVLGLALMAYVVPVYLQIPARVSVRVLVLMVGLLGVYSLIHILISRRIISFGPCVGPSWRWDCSFYCARQATPEYRSSVAGKVNWQQSRSSAFHWWWLACVRLLVAK